MGQINEEGAGVGGDAKLLVSRLGVESALGYLDRCEKYLWDVALPRSTDGANCGVREQVFAALDAHAWLDGIRREVYRILYPERGD